MNKKLESKLIKKIKEKLGWRPFIMYQIKKVNNKVIFSNPYSIGKPIIKSIVEVFQENRDLDNEYIFIMRTDNIIVFLQK